MEYWKIFWFYVALKVAKVFWSLYLLLTFKELVSWLLYSSVKSLRFLINWQSSLWWKRFVGVVIVSLVSLCLCRKVKYPKSRSIEPRVRCTFKHLMVEFITIFAFDMNPVVTVITENCHIRSFVGKLYIC